VLVLIIGVMGGLYAGVVTPTEGGAVGAFLAALIGVVQRKLNVEGFIEALKDAMATTAQLFFVGMGAILFTKFLALSRRSSGSGRSIPCSWSLPYRSSTSFSAPSWTRSG
jgi:TRAP-type C4-dicarboxylate transport system permease large subunit